MNVENKTATELKALTIQAIQRKDRKLLDVLKAEALRRVNEHNLNGTATAALNLAAGKLIAAK